MFTDERQTSKFMFVLGTLLTTSECELYVDFVLDAKMFVLLEHCILFGVPKESTYGNMFSAFLSSMA